MNENEFLFPAPDGDRRTTGGGGPMPDLTDEETARLVSLLREAYPSPPSGFGQRVMARIRAESAAAAETAGTAAAAENAGRTAVVTEPADSRKNGEKKSGRRRIFARAARYGALAACVALVGAVAVKVLPTFTRDLAKEAAMDAASYSAETVFDGAERAEADEAAPEMAVESACASGQSSGVNSSAKDAEAPAAFYYDADLPAEDDEAVADSAWDIVTAETERAAAVPEMPAPEPAPEYGAYAAGAADMIEAEEAVAEAEEEPSAEAGGYGDALGSSLFAVPGDPGSTAGGAGALYDDGMIWDEAFSAPGADGDPGFTEEYGMSIRLFNLNGANGMDGLLPGEAEAKRMTAAAANALPTLDPEGERREKLTYYYVRTACSHSGAFRNSYHDIPDVLIAKVGPELFGAWATKVQREDLCGVNIVSFAVRFGLTAEDILSTGDVWYYFDLPEGLELTEENAALVEQYYLDGGDPGKMAPRYLAYEFKTAVVREVGIDAYLAWRGEDTALKSWTLGEAAERFGLSSERMAELYEEARGAALELCPGAEVPELYGMLGW